MNRDRYSLAELVDDNSVLHVDELVEQGECRYCGCTHDAACQLEEEPFTPEHIPEHPDV